MSLNFEDINYYTYSENDSGQEIYGKNAIIPISSAPTTGGLVWDEYGAVVQEMNWTGDVTVTGTDLEINNPLNYRVAFQDVKLFGNSVQSGSPSISNPASITLVSGVQTITVTDENNNTDTYTINLGSYELNKVWGYTDSIHKSAGSWVLEKQTGKFIINNNLTVVSTSSTTIELVTPVLTIRHNLNYISLAGNAKSDKLSVGNGSNQMYATTNDGRIRIRLSKQFPISALNGTVIYYGLSTPTLTTLSGTLATALDTLLAGELFTGNNVITTTVSAGTEKPTLSFTYYTELDSSEGFVWEEGSGGGPTTVTIEAVDNVYPIWEVVGPAINPQLANLTTNTALTYVGTVNAGQTLKIDMTNKLATLNGTSVISNVNGEWVYFKPGDNRITYTALNNDADPSTIQWQEIVG